MEAVQTPWSCPKCGSRYDAGVKYCLHCRTEAQLKKAANPYNSLAWGIFVLVGVFLVLGWIILNVIANNT